MTRLQRLGRGLMLLAAVCMAPAAAFEVTDIQLEGLERISAGTVFNYLPIKIGDEVDSADVSKAIRTLFKTGFFSDVQLLAEANVLIVVLEERPAISEIDIEGNELLETEPLLEGLAGIGLAKGRVFKRALLEQVEQELRRQYFGQGQYSVRIESTVTPLGRNRVAIKIIVTEGATAKIRQINIVGNEAFDDDALRDQFKLSTPTLFSFISNNDQYSKQKLAGDLETIRSHYLNLGYINFRISSTQVSVSPDKLDIYITINVSEGEQFTISEVKLTGDLIVPANELVDLIQSRPQDIFSRQQVTATSRLLSERLGEEGYAFANVNTIPKIDNEKNTVALTFFVDPGHQVYVRRINFSGNSKTRDEVLRREMRQIESARISTTKVSRSKERLQRLGYFQDVNVETPPVPGLPDQVDVNYSVVEQASGNIVAGIGFSQSQGVILNASVSQSNFMGSGKQVSFAINNSDLNQTYSFAFTNPFFTVDGVSRGFNISYRETDADEVDIARYSTDVFSTGVTYGIPVNEFDRVRFGLRYENTVLTSGIFASDEVNQFVLDNGDKFDTISANVSWSHDSRNKAIFPTRGDYQQLSLDLALPGGGLEFYKAQYKLESVRPLPWGMTVSVKGEIGYGDGYGDTNGLPLFENFFAGGARSVRGYEDFSLSPLDTNGDPLGGNLKTTGSLEVYIPVPLDKFKNSVRIGAFFDVGNAFGTNDKFALSELRSSVGVSGIWISPMGPMKLSIATPINDQATDEIQSFQFALGAF